MTMSDPIADLLTRIRNGIQVRRKYVDVPSSKLKSSLALVLMQEGYVRKIESREDKKGFGEIRIHLKYDNDGIPAISEIRRYSKPGRRVYTSARKIPVVRRGLGTAILTTPQGLMTGRQALEKGVGGEVLCTVF